MTGLDPVAAHNLRGAGTYFQWRPSCARPAPSDQHMLEFRVHEGWGWGGGWGLEILWGAIDGSGCLVSCAGFRIQGSGFRVWEGHAFMTYQTQQGQHVLGGAPGPCRLRTAPGDAAPRIVTSPNCFGV